jgi:hypothetical protein
MRGQPSGAAPGRAGGGSGRPGGDLCGAVAGDGLLEILEAGGAYTPPGSSGAAPGVRAR